MANYTTAQKVSEYTKGKITVLDVKNEWLGWVDDYIDRFTGLKFGDAIVFDIKLDGNDLDWIFIPHYPIQSITLLKIGDTEIDSPDYKFYATGRISLENNYFVKGLQNIQVTGTYGFSAVPGVVEQIATVLTVGICYAAKDGKSPDVKSERIGDYSVTYLGIAEGEMEKQLKVLGKRHSLEGI